jgi:hypothetical protein
MGVDTPGKKEEKKLLYIAMFGGLLVIIVATAYISKFHFGLYPIPISNDTAEWAQFGDFIGGTLNPLLSFLALIAILITFKGQILELNQSHKELAKANKHKKEELNINLKQFQKIDCIEFIKLVDTDVKSSLEEEVTVEDAPDQKFFIVMKKAHRRFKQSGNNEFLTNIIVHKIKIMMVYDKINMIFENARKVDGLIGDNYYQSYYEKQYKDFFDQLNTIVKGFDDGR